MDMGAITSLVGSLGFPIVVAIYMIYVNTKQSERHENENKSMTEAINELKIVIEKLLTKMDADEEKEA